MARVPRFDIGEQLAPPERMPNGWIRVQGKLARCGIQIYAGPDGKPRRELRLPEEVFAPATLASFKGVPVCNTHPPVLLDDKNTKFYGVGSLSDPARTPDDWMIGDLLITEAEARAAAERGRNELSNGYECDQDETQHPELVAKWGPYDSIQRNIRGNHVALVDEARAGHDAQARMDARGATMLASSSVKRGALSMGTVRIDGITLDVNDANVGAIQQAIDRFSEQTRALIAGNTTKLDSAIAGKTKALQLFDSLHAILKRGKQRRDAVKARMMGCDECGGTGTVSDDGVDKKCDYCDGKGSFRMHDKMADLSSAASVEPESEEHGEFGSDPTDDDDDIDDADELQVERETEENGAEGVARAKVKKDGISSRRAARRDARRETGRKQALAAKKARQDSLQRRIDRAARARTKLETTAARILGEGWKADGKSDEAVRKEVVMKVSPEAKLDGKDRAYLQARFDIAVEQSAAGITAVDLARGAGGGNPPAGSGGTRADGAIDPDKARLAMLERNKNVSAIKAK